MVSGASSARAGAPAAVIGWPTVRWGLAVILVVGLTPVGRALAGRPDEVRAARDAVYAEGDYQRTPPGSEGSEAAAIEPTTSPSAPAPDGALAAGSSVAA